MYSLYRNITNVLCLLRKIGKEQSTFVLLLLSIKMVILSSPLTPLSIQCYMILFFISTLPVHGARLSGRTRTMHTGTLI